ncbi:LysM peptidoglycan-binding domain-containing protein [Bacillus sp. JJ722]|uniref:LysM peptidoglycan-binding domain-containing protein n=1 Tax=Bacillus sp. JJ722 TaxID=3122973 RepID=UPI002FFF17A5
MTNQERNDQAEHLRKKVDAKQNEDEFSVASLPSRKEVHGKKKQKMVWKIKFPLVKLLALFFVLLPITIFAFYTYFTKDDKPAFTKEEESSFSSEVNVDGKYEDEVVKKEDSPKDKDKNEDQKEKKLANNDEKEGKSKVDKPSSELNVKSKEETKGDSNHPNQKVPVKNEPKEPEKKPVVKPEVPDKNENTSKVIEHVVKPQETIFRIAMNYYSSQSGIEKIKQANGLSSNDIRVGQVLKIPMD